MNKPRERSKPARPNLSICITSENKDYQVALGGGLMWLDNTCIDRYGKPISIAPGAAERNS